MAYTVHVSIILCATSDNREITSDCSGLDAIVLHAEAAVIPELIPGPNVPKPVHNAADT